MNRRNLKFALLLEDGKPVRSIDELRMYYDIDKVLAYFNNGQLERWLEQNEYEEQFKMIKKLKKSLETELINGINSILIECKQPSRLYEECSEQKHENKFKRTPETKHLEFTPKPTLNNNNDIEKMEVLDENIHENQDKGVFGIEYSNEDKNNTHQTSNNNEKTSRNSNEKIETLCSQQSKYNTSKTLPNFEFKQDALTDVSKTNMFQKPLFMDKNEEICELGKTNFQQEFKRRRGNSNILSNNNEIVKMKEIEEKAEDISQLKKIDFDFFDDDFSQNVELQLDKKPINEQKKEDYNEVIINDTVSDVSGIESDISDTSSNLQSGFISKKVDIDEPKRHLSIKGENKLLESEDKSPMIKLRIGMDKFTTTDSINQPLNIGTNRNYTSKDIKMEISPSKPKINNGSEVEDSRKNLLQQKKNSVFSKIKSENNVVNNHESGIGMKTTNIVPKSTKIGINNTKTKFNNPMEDELNNAASEIKEDIGLSSNIDIDNIIQKINQNVENNAKLYEDYKSEKKEKDISLDKIDSKHNFFEEKVVEVQQPSIDYIDSTTKLYKQTVYNQRDYENLLERRNNTDIRLKVIVSCNNLKIRDTDVNIEYIGIDKPTILLVGKKEFDSVASNMSFKNLKISSLDSIMFNYDKLDNVVIDKIKIKKGIRELMDKYPGMAFKYNRCSYLLEQENPNKDGNSVEGYVKKIFKENIDGEKIMATVEFDGLHIYTNINMGIINLAFCRTTKGEAHDISEFFVGSESIDVLNKDSDVGIEYVALITESVAENIRKDSEKKYESITEIVEDIFSNKEMYKYLEHVILSPVRIFKESETISRIDQVKMIDVMNIDTEIPYIYKIFEGNEVIVKDSLINFINTLSENRIENSIRFKGINIELLREELEQEDRYNIAYNFE